MGQKKYVGKEDGGRALLTFYGVNFRATTSTSLEHVGKLLPPPFLPPSCSVSVIVPLASRLLSGRKQDFFPPPPPYSLLPFGHWQEGARVINLIPEGKTLSFLCSIVHKKYCHSPHERPSQEGGKEKKSITKIEQRRRRRRRFPKWNGRRLFWGPKSCFDRHS